MLQLFVGFLSVRFVVAQGKIAAVNGNAHKAIAHGVCTKIRFHKLLLLAVIHQRIDIGGRIRNGTAEALHGLIGNVGIAVNELLLLTAVIRKRNLLHRLDRLIFFIYSRKNVRFIQSPSFLVFDIFWG